MCFIDTVVWMGFGQNHTGLGLMLVGILTTNTGGEVGTTSEVEEGKSLDRYSVCSSVVMS